MDADLWSRNKISPTSPGFDTQWVFVEIFGTGKLESISYYVELIA